MRLAQEIVQVQLHVNLSDTIPDQISESEGGPFVALSEDPLLLCLHDPHACSIDAVVAAACAIGA